MQLISLKGGSTSPNLLKATVTVLDNASCKLQYSTLTSNMICAAAPGKDTCQVKVSPLFVFYFYLKRISDWFLPGGQWGSNDG
jgi:hypothetical protein